MEDEEWEELGLGGIGKWMTDRWNCWEEAMNGLCWERDSRTPKIAHLRDIKS